MQLQPITAIVVLLFLVASLLIAGCITNTTSSSSTPTPSAAAPAAGDRLTMTAYRVDLSTVPIVSVFHPSAGNEYAIYYCKINNINADNYGMSYAFFKLRDSNGNTYSPKSEQIMQAGDFPAYYVSTNGDSVAGYVLFEVQAGSQFKTISYQNNAYDLKVNL
jgi:Domain of unknown function (DUF4352)